MPRPRDAQDEAPAEKSTLRSILQGIFVFVAAQLVVRAVKSYSNSVTSSNLSTFETRPESVSPKAETYRATPLVIEPIWASNTSVDIEIYISPSVFRPAINSKSEATLITREKNFRIGDWQDRRKIDTTIDFPEEVRNNGTLWAHFFVAVSGHPLDASDPNYDASKAYHFPRPLTQYLLKKKVAKTRNLLGGSSNATGEKQDNDGGEPPRKNLLVSFYHPNITVSIIPDSGQLNYPTMHPAMRQFVQLESSGARDPTGQNGWYYPILFLNTFWQLRDHMTELNMSTPSTLPLHLELNNMQNWKFGIFSSMDASVKQNQQQLAHGGPMPAGGDGSELDEVKRILLDTNIYLLATTGVVTLLHTLFEMLAFKNDIAHWRNKKDNVGVSVRTILVNVVSQLLIFLYLLDNSEGTSWVILFGQGFGIALEAWKVTRAVNVRVRPAPEGALIPYRVTFEDKHKLSDKEQETQEYDAIAFKYLYLVAVPLLGAYAVYSLIYETHKSWYSFIITTLVGSVYAYGFLMMVPSLYINYRLKSVAHISQRAMTYKFLNTFIDDLFAWTIKMPTLHRLATLRDDVIFFIYIYQSWIYRVDYTRVNEFGQGGEEDEDEVQEKKKKTIDDDGKNEKNVIDGVSVVGEGQETEKMSKGGKAKGKVATSGRDGDTSSGDVRKR
ncbi:MAG: hypothetical protein M1823_003683 [Watsoniomyces obsoletus]|nr:MAG: hypothetical protein M1823_003683 [Watsoniomyces obsoletus]